MKITKTKNAGRYHASTGLILVLTFVLNLVAFAPAFAQLRKANTEIRTNAAPLGNLQPGTVVWDQSQFDVTNGWDIAGAVVSENFQLQKPRRLTSFSFWLGDGAINDNGSIDSYSGTLGVAIYSDLAGEPGTLLQSFTVNPTVVDTGLQSGTNSDVALVDVVFPAPINLVAGTYWIAVHDGAWGSGDDLSPVYILTTPVIFGQGNMGAFPTPSPSGWTMMGGGFDVAIQLRAESAWDQTAFNTANGYDITGSALADDFTVATTTTLDGFTVVLTDDVSNDNGSLDSFNGTLGWTIYSDAPNAVGTPIASGNATPFLLDTGRQTVNGFDIVRADVNFPSNIVLPPGTYWFALREGSNGTPSDGTAVHWAFSNSSTGGLPEVILIEPEPTVGLMGLPDVAFGLWGLAPTAASATVSGRVTDESGRFVRNATVTIAGLDGTVQHVRTNTFGSFTFSDVRSGESYLISVSAKRMRFDPQLISVTDDVTDIIITGR